MGKLQKINFYTFLKKANKLEQFVNYILQSYGGFLSAMALFQANSPFKCAISGAPVSDWLFYGNKTYKKTY